MDGWMDGWMDGCMHGCTDGRTDLDRSIFVVVAVVDVHRICRQHRT